MQPADGKGDRALAATRFPGEAEELARRDVEADILDDFVGLRVAAEVTARYGSGLCRDALYSSRLK
jgi:hypothetical protein